MGNKLLVLIALPMFLIASNLPSIDKKYLSDIVAKIKKARKGLSKREIKRLRNPFYIKKTPKKETIKIIPKIYKKTYRLYAIINNRVKINGKWYKIGEKIDEYRISKGKEKKILLISANEKISLSLTKKENKRIKIERIGKKDGNNK
jgi:hypothetical protein